jgi:hypothetical protein
LHPWLQEQLLSILASEEEARTKEDYQPAPRCRRRRRQLNAINGNPGSAGLNMAESMQRILVRRALSGQDPHTPQQIIDWLEQTVAGWNQDPTPFVWNGKRRERRQRARLKRLAGSGAAVLAHAS